MKILIVSLVCCLLLGCDDKPCDPVMHEECNSWLMPMWIGKQMVMMPQEVCSCVEDQQ